VRYADPPLLSPASFGVAVGRSGLVPCRVPAVGKIYEINRVALASGAMPPARAAPRFIRQARPAEAANRGSTGNPARSGAPNLGTDCIQIYHAAFRQSVFPFTSRDAAIDVWAPKASRSVR
jgi:hypothetical protein